DPVEIGLVLFPVIRVSGDLDRLVRLEFDEFERAGTDRMSAHVARRHVAGIDRRESRSEQRDEGGLRPLQSERHLVVAIDGYLFEVPVPGLAGIDAELLGRLTGQ